MNAQPHIILASGSAARRAMLENAGLTFETKPADIDEEALIQTLQETKTSTKDITARLAQEKALHIGKNAPSSLIIGSDQTLEFKGTLLTKAKDKQDAAQKLKSLRGKTHHLHSAVSVTQNDKTIFTHTNTASLTMHDFSDNFLEAYMQKDPEALTSCVGGYKIEGAGAWLFSEITGDNFTIMGMPLLPLLTFLNKNYKLQQ